MIEFRIIANVYNKIEFVFANLGVYRRWIRVNREAERVNQEIPILIWPWIRVNREAGERTILEGFQPSFPLFFKLSIEAGSIEAGIPMLN